MFTDAVQLNRRHQAVPDERTLGIRVGFFGWISAGSAIGLRGGLCPFPSSPKNRVHASQKQEKDSNHDRERIRGRARQV